MKVINSLTSLIHQLNNSTKNEYAEIGVRLDISIDQFASYCFWNDKHYTRNCIARSEHYELILLCWNKGQSTPIHCHGNQECWVYVVDGQLEEEHYQYDNNKLDLESTELLSTGEKSFMCDDLGYHKLLNKADGRSMSLHLYMDPIENCTKFNDQLNLFEQVDLSYYSFEGKKVKNLITV